MGDRKRDGEGERKSGREGEKDGQSGKEKQILAKDSSSGSLESVLRICFKATYVLLINIKFMSQFLVVVFLYSLLNLEHRGEIVKTKIQNPSGPSSSEQDKDTFFIHSH